MTFHKKLQTLWIFAHIFLIYTLITDFSVLKLGLAVLWALLINVGTEAGGHRYFVHKSYKTSKLKERILLALQTISGEGSILSFCGVHRQHHQFADQEKDPHSPVHKSWLSIIYWIDPISVNPRYVKDWLKDKWVKAQHDYYFEIHIALFVVISLVGGISAYGYLVALSIVLTVYANAATNIIGHTRSIGYRNYETKDNSTNIDGIFNVLLMGGGLQNNHHGNQNSYTNKFKDSDHDSIGWIIEKFLKHD